MDPYARIARRLRHPDRPIEQESPCVGATDLFYGPYEDLREEPLEDRLDREDRAKQVCETCFMRLECLSFAMLHRESGVWGGMTPGERREFRKSLKKIYKDWKNAVIDLDTLRWRSEAFLKKRKEERAKQHRESEPEGNSGRAATAVIISGSSRSRPRPVAQGNRSGAARGKSSTSTGRQSSRPPANQPKRATGKAASPKRDDHGRGVQR